MPEIWRYPLQALNFAVFMALVWYFSASPVYVQLQPDQAVVTVAFAHAGERLGDCRQLSQAELAKLPPNMRAPMDCPRERSPVSVKLLMDGELLINEVMYAPGLYSDLGIDVYHSAKVPAGKHTLAVEMNDNARVEGPTYTHEVTVTLDPAQLLVIDFDSENGTFIIE